MDSLNKAWITLIIVGLLALIFAIGIRVYESFQGNNEEFFITINEIPSKVLLSPAVEEHLKSSGEISLNSEN